ncbi:hypothetical protein ACFQV2_37420 [Actinokineospora soli]|uniref:Uncharacterized protein n=1 Tax=Actinokineospora soli TaxID=1048753 RepID=A0ABW2TZV3_9PSEU
MTTTREAEVLPPLKLGAALRDAKVAWPEAVGRVGEGAEWYAFDASRSATFHLVTADKARRLVTVAVGTAPGECPGDGCVEYPTGDPRTRVYVRELPPTEPAAPRAVEVVALRDDGVVVRVLESAGFGPPWRTEPVLPVATLVGLATIPEFAAR